MTDRKRFENMMNAIDDRFLEEAAVPKKKTPVIRWALPVAAALCLVLGLSALSRDRIVPAAGGNEASLQAQALQKAEEQTQPAEQEMMTLAAPQDPGAALSDAMDQMYLLTARGESAAAEFSLNGADYVCVADPSGELREGVSWQVDMLCMNLSVSAQETTVSWSGTEDGMVWNLTSSAPQEEVLTTAREILLFGGMDVAVAPEGAEQIRYNVLEEAGLVAAETKFVADGTEYTFRMASTPTIGEDFEDISGLAISADAEERAVRWCPAKMYLSEDGAGKIIWFDVVPGLVYSLSAEEHAEADELQAMAEAVFAPAQGDVG